MKTIIYDNDGQEVFSQSISIDQHRVSIIDLNQLMVAVKVKSTDTGNFTMHSLELFQIIEEVCNQLTSYNSSNQDFTSSRSQAEFRRYVSKYSREDEISGDDELFKEQSHLMPQDSTLDRFYKRLSDQSRLEQDIQSLERMSSLTLKLHDAIKIKKVQLENMLRPLTESNSELFSMSEDASIEKKWAMFFGSVLGLKEVGSDIDLDDLLLSFKDFVKNFHNETHRRG